MPFTPFHFGPGLLLEAVAPRAFSLVTFIIVQVLIDFETLYFLLRREWPVHRVLHTLVGGTVLGLAVGGAAWMVGSGLVARSGPAGLGRFLQRTVRAEVSLLGTLLEGAIGGASHSVLDGMMHADVRPYWPFSSSPGWMGLIRVDVLHSACALAGVLGVVALWLTRRSWTTGK
jgi:hypothetical protein